MVTGALRLHGVRVGVPLELRECTFAHAPGLRMAELSGLALTGSRLPGLLAGNLRVAADLLLDDGFDAAGSVDLTDAQIGGSLRLSGGRLRGSGEHALVADRVVVEGTWYARRLRADAEVRLPGARVTGNVDLAGAALTSPTGDALDGTGITVGGSLLAGRHATGPAFTASGRVRLAGARIGGDLVFSGAEIVSTTIQDPGEDAPEGSRAPVLPAGIVDPAACLVADRLHVDGNLELDDGLRTTGTLRLPNAVIGGYLRLSGAQLTAGSARGIALLADKVDTRIRFLGAPAGYDFMALVDAILAISGASDSELSAESLALVAGVTTPTRIQVFVTPTCSYCPRAVGLANRMAAANPNISATTVQATEFYDLASRFRVTGVPKTVVNEQIEILGALPEPDFIRAALSIED
jgi:thiol-disulfide isomerase/thioredoxin